MHVFSLLDELRTVTDTVESFEIAGDIFSWIVFIYFYFLFWGPRD